VLKRSGRELIENSRDDTTWVKVQLQELSNRWDTVCKLSVSKQTRLEQALKQVSGRRRVETVLGSFAGLQVRAGRSTETSAKRLCPGTDLLAEQSTPALRRFPVRAAKRWVGVRRLLVLSPGEEPVKAGLKWEDEKALPTCAAGAER